MVDENTSKMFILCFEQEQLEFWEALTQVVSII